MLTAERLIEMLQLEPLPIEGGFYRRTYVAPRFNGTPSGGLPLPGPHPRSYGSAIYFLLYDEHVSLIHRLVTDEVYHFYLGDPVDLLLLFPDGRSQVIVLGHDLEAGQHVQVVVPAGVWQGSRVRPGGRFGLMGTTMAPAYAPEDCELAERNVLRVRYPAVAALIEALTPASEAIND